jgi:prepilin-type processing-associated H-X9-DG protein
MQRVLSAQRGIILSAILAYGGAAALAEDMAQVMPRDAALYIGWSQGLAPDAPELRMQKQLISAVIKTATEQGADAEDIKWIAPLLEVFEPLETGSVGLGLFDVTLVSDQPQIDAALIVAGPDARKLPEAVHQLFAATLGAEHIKPHAVQNTPLECAQLEDAPLLPVWGMYKEYFILALGDSATGKVIDCIDKRAPSLAAAEEFTFDRKKVATQASGKHFCLYADVQRIVARGRAIAQQAMGELPPMVDQALNELGLTSIRSKYVVIDTLDGQPRMMAFAHVEGAKRGLLKLWDQQPLTDDDLKIIPKDAYWAEVGNLNLAGLWTEVMRVFEALAPDKLPLVQGPLAMSTQMLGFSITDELLPAFGDTWAIFDAPAHGGILLSGTVLVAEVQDSDRLHGMLKRLVELATPFAREGDATLKLTQLKHGEHTVNYVLIGGVPCPVAPAWGFVDGRFVFGLFPQTVATAMQQVDPKTRGESLLDHPDFKAARAKLPKEVQSIGYFDSKYFTRMFYPLVNLVRTAGISMLAKYGAEIDLALMPPLPEMVREITNCVSTTSTDADGILYASRGNGAPVLIVVAGTAMATSVMLPSLARAREVAKRAVSASNLRGIGMGCHFHANDNRNRFPDSFEQLLQDGAIVHKQLHSPRDVDEDEDHVSYVYIAGQTTDAKPNNVLAYERLLDEEGTNVLFVDGHVEWLRPDAFRAAVRETYRRLGRMADLPTEFQGEE